MNLLKQFSEKNKDHHTYKASMTRLKAKHKNIFSSLCLFIAVCVSSTVSGFETKIVGGIKAAANKYPFMVSVEKQVDNTQFLVRV